MDKVLRIEKKEAYGKYLLKHLNYLQIFYSMIGLINRELDKLKKKIKEIELNDKKTRKKEVNFISIHSSQNYETDNKKQGCYKAY